LNLADTVRQFFAKQWSKKFFELYDHAHLHPIEVAKRQPFIPALPAALHP
jgi:hypothetical protein